MKKPTLSATGRVLSALQKLTSDKKSEPIAEFSMMSESILSDVKYVLRTGIDTYDSLTGALPFGRIVELYGVDACGKTALAKKAGINAQLKNVYKRIVTLGPDNVKRTTYEKLDPDKIDVCVLYFDNEQTMADDNTLIVDGQEAEFIMARCDTIDTIFKAIEVTTKMVEDTSKDSDREQFILVVIDTIASTSTRQEIDQDLGVQNYSRGAKELRECFRKMSRMINKHNVCLLCLNQVSDSFTQMKKNPNALPDENSFSTFGGRALKFYASQRIFLQKVPKKYRLHPDNKLEDGLLIEVKTVKNRIKKPLRKARMVLLFGDEHGAGGGFNKIYSMLETFIMLDMAKDDAGSVSFRFQAHGITPSTFESKRANPSIDNRLEWPSYYNDHKVDFDALWEAAEKKIFSAESQVDSSDSDDDDDEIFGKKAKDDDDII